MGELQERITSTKTGSITSIQAVYVPADDLTDPSPATTFGHLDSTIVLSRDIASLGIYPSVDPLDSTSRQLDPHVVGEDHYKAARACSRRCSATRSCATSSPFSAWTNSRRRTSWRWRARARSSASCRSRSTWPKCSPAPPASIVPLKDTIQGFKAIVDGEYDHLPEQAFYMVGAIEEAIEKAKTLQ